MLAYFKNIYKNRELLSSLFYKQFSGRYKQSIFGPAWAIIQPVAYMVIFTIIRGSGAVQIDVGEIPYPIFTYAALMPWTFFSNSVSLGVSSVVSNAAVVKKIYFPREILPTAAVMVSFINFCIASVVYIGLMVYFGIFPSFQVIIIPLLLIIQTIFALSICLIGSSLGVYRRDIIFGITFLIQFLLFLTPIMYSIEKIPQRYLALYLWLNPMAGIIESYRAVLIYKVFPPISYILCPFTVSVLLFLAAYKMFKILERSFADVI